MTTKSRVRARIYLDVAAGRLESLEPLDASDPDDVELVASCLARATRATDARDCIRWLQTAAAPPVTCGDIPSISPAPPVTCGDIPPLRGGEVSGSSRGEGAARVERPLVSSASRDSSPPLPKGGDVGEADRGGPKGGGRRGARFVADMLAAAARNSTWSTARAAAITALAAWAGAYPVARGVWRDTACHLAARESRWTVRAAVVDSAPVTAFDQALEPLAIALTDPHWRVRNAIVVKLRPLLADHPGLIERLESACPDPVNPNPGARTPAKRAQRAQQGVLQMIELHREPERIETDAIDALPEPYPWIGSGRPAPAWWDEDPAVVLRNLRDADDDTLEAALSTWPLLLGFEHDAVRTRVFDWLVRRATPELLFELLVAILPEPRLPGYAIEAVARLTERLDMDRREDTSRLLLLDGGDMPAEALIWALERVGTDYPLDDAAIATRLAELVEDVRADVRAATAAAWSRLDAEAPGRDAALASLLTDVDGRVRAAALGDREIGVAAIPALPVRTHSEAWELALASRLAVEPDVPAWRELVDRLCHHELPTVRIGVARVLAGVSDLSTRAERARADALHLPISGAESGSGGPRWPPGNELGRGGASHPMGRGESGPGGEMRDATTRGGRTGGAVHRHASEDALPGGGALRHDPDPRVRAAALTPEMAAELWKPPVEERSLLVLEAAATLLRKRLSDLLRTVPELDPGPLQRPPRAAVVEPADDAAPPSPTTVAWGARLGISGHYGLPEAGYARAFERGVRLFIWEPNYLAQTRFFRTFSQRHEVCHLVGTFEADAERILRDIERALRALRIERIGLFQIFWSRSRARLDEEVFETLEQARMRGDIADWGVSTHQRDLAVELVEQGIDPIMVRHNAAHRGIETSVLPAAQAAGARVITFSTLMYGRMLERPSPLAPEPPSALDCYRYSLSQPGVRAVLSAPATLEALAENLDALDAPPMSGEEVERIRAFGDEVVVWSRAFARLVRWR